MLVYHQHRDRGFILRVAGNTLVAQVNGNIKTRHLALYPSACFPDCFLSAPMSGLSFSGKLKAVVATTREVGAGT